MIWRTFRSHSQMFHHRDQLGGNGWEVELPDGTIQKYYVYSAASFSVPSSPSQGKADGVRRSGKASPVGRVPSIVSFEPRHSHWHAI
jgi:hypothetical protein